MFSKAIIVLAAVAGLVSASPAPKSVVSAPVAERDDHWGTGTVYTQQGAAGSCGQYHSDYDMIAALTYTYQGSTWPPAQCGRQIQITNTGSNDGVGGAGNSVIVTVADTCPGCPSADSIDLSVGAWNALTNGAPWGTVNIDWHFI